ncbi:unnamed protein product [Timema podura]|uniref:Major facilitator superfamily (MFS) profile domain-containing protein n=1 Tax=Timema podura TaxID=61482 RepID=A0ABN7NJM6_TIMPD|nr:unnamed protein product [Timema podura]
MSNFFVRNLCLKQKLVITTKDDKEPAPPWVPAPNGTLINYTRSKLFPQLLAAVMACWINLASGASLGYITPALPSLQHPSSRLQLSETEGSWVASLVMLGALGGGCLAGPCISLGRRKALWLAAVPLTSAWLIIAVAPNVWALYAAHTILGACLGVICDASQLYVSETASSERRGALGCVPVLMFNVGILLCYTAGAWLDWENLALFGCLISVPALLLPIVLPETPSYLVARERTKEALASLHWLRGSNCDINAEYQELLQCKKGAGLIERIQGLCDREIIRPVMITAAIRMLSRFCGLRAILCYTQAILLTSRSAVDVDIATIIIGAVQLIATLVACGLLDKLGRRKLLIVSQTVMGVSLVTLGCYLYYRNDMDRSDGSVLGWIPIVAILIYIVGNSMGLGPVSGIAIGELVPQRHRSIASSLTGAMSWLSAFIVTKTFLDLQSSLHIYGALWLYGSVCFVGVPFVYFCLPETRGISQYAIEVLFKCKDSISDQAISDKPSTDKIEVTIQN